MLVTSASAAKAIIPVGSALNLSASGGDTYQWHAPDNASFSAPANASATVASLSIAGPKTFTVVISQGSCSQSQLVSVTATNGPDLSPIIILPDANFPANSSKDFVVRLFEVGWVATAPNSVTMTVTAPIGYSLIFNEALTSTNVAGDTQNPVTVNNADWSVNNDPTGRQLSFWMKSGSWI